MSEFTSDAGADFSPGYMEALRKRIGWICQTVRWAACFYAGWILWLMLRFWLDAEMVRRSYSFQTKMTLTPPDLIQRLGGLGLNLIDWALIVAAIYSVWRLMGEYLAGRIFQPTAAVWLRRVGTFGLAAMAFDILCRPLLSGIVSLHLPEGARFISIAFQPNDLLNTMFLLSFVALAHVFKSAAELADDNAHII